MILITDPEQLLQLVKGAGPFRVQGTSVDVTASGVFHREAISPEGRIEDYFTTGPDKPYTEEITAAHVDIPPGGYVVCETTEMVDFTPRHCGMCQSLAGLNLAGISLFGSAWVRPSWAGRLQVGLRNNNRAHSYRLKAGAPIAQLVVFGISDDHPDRIRERSVLLG